MISYMLPAVEEKPLAEIDGIDKEEGRDKFEEVVINEATEYCGLGPIDKDTSFNSFLSDATTLTVSHSSMTNTSLSDKGKPKFINGGKLQSLKRVSFGCSHGSMVETLVFESPTQEEAEQKNQQPYGDYEECALSFQENQDQTETEREKVRVKFFQQLKPQEVDLPPNELTFEEDLHLLMAATVAINDSNHHFQRMESVESGWDNPFRPGGDLSREADEIVELIKEGKPITPISSEQHQDEHDSSLPEAEQNLIQNHLSNNVLESPVKKHQPSSVEATPKSANGKVNKTEDKTDNSCGAVDVKRGTVKPDGDASQVEHITIKKKPKCKCCVIQ